MTDSFALVETVDGPVRGVDDGRVTAWKGVRYAAPPIGDLRWRAPQPVTPWKTVADATRYGFVCPQPVDPRIPIELGAPQGEDCLTLNVWASSDTAAGDRKPVMVWIHGGAYIIGSASQPLYDGRVLAGGGGVVVVTVNYRLGALGFLDLSEFDSARRHFDSNLGLRDVLAALQWVRDNVAAFGGDPDRVTLFGESAGAGIITTLLTMPAAEGLFAGAIAQSSPATSVYDISRARRVARQVLDRLGLTPSDIHRLPDVPVEAIVAASTDVFYETPVSSPGTLAFAPNVDGQLVPDYPVKVARDGRAHPVPLVIGTNKHEAALFKWMKSPLMPITPEAINAMFTQIAAEQPHVQLPTRDFAGTAYARLRGKARGMSVARDIGFRMPSVWLAEGHSAVAPVYLYRFDFATPMLRLLRIAAAHATELPFVWGNLVTSSKDPTFKLGGLKTGRVVSARVRARWTNFAIQAKPTGLPGEPEWLPYQEPDRSSLLIDRQDTVVNDIDADIRATWGTEVLNFR
ncbi:carboxylesterase/lipase family protein [Mycobacterium sp. 1274761.0]|uniref:carboxylesterase/lipase family protein n=1 Tax=Mycobacterium sp. 1274761.0 TaxID=1834077 RepID=UPI0007FD9F3F|nr:carboxylesterase/lipase family protein [Mycobacterium sp. 1274761.0]OBK78819.1 carboxylesterase [Mycobacterium sp. 1274761.0]